MSIINEALKKTEQHLQENAVKNTPLTPKPWQPKLFLLYVLILSAGLLLGNFIFNLLKHKTEPNRAAIKDILPVALHIPGCPPNPLAIIKSLLGFLRKT